MSNNDFLVLLQAVLDESGVKKSLKEIQDIANKNQISIGIDTDKSQKKIDSLANSMLTFKKNNTKMTKSMKIEISEMYDALINGANLSDREIEDLRHRFNKFKLEVRDAGKLGKSFGDSIKQGMGSFGAWLPASSLVMGSVNAIRNMVREVKDLDTELVDLRKTANMSASELEGFYYASNETAKQMGATTKEILAQASAWSRLGFNTAESATKMAKYSSLFATISPGMSLDSATDGLVSIMKAFKIGLEDTDEVVDGIMSKVNIIGNTRALDNNDIIEFLTRSSAAMAEANNTLEDTIALGTAITEITRDASNAGQVLKTVSMRIRGYDEETEEYIGGVEELSGKIANLTKTASTPGGISLFTDETKETFKSTRELFDDIASIYQDLTDKQQAGLLEALAGKRNGQAVAAILNNYDAVRESLDSMANSAGNAEAEMAIAIDSIAYKANKTREIGTGIAQNLFGRNDMKDTLDAINMLGEGIDWLTEKLDLFGTIALAGGGILGANNLG